MWVRGGSIHTHPIDVCVAIGIHATHLPTNCQWADRHTHVGFAVLMRQGAERRAGQSGGSVGGPTYAHVVFAVLHETMIAHPLTNLGGLEATLLKKLV